MVDDDRPDEGAESRLLIVDDDELMLRTMKRALREHHVVATTSARKALALVAEGERFDAILCDMMMPEITGAELYEALAAVAPDQTARVGFVTGGATTPATMLFVASSPRPVLSKPFRREEIRAFVRELLSAKPGRA